MVCFYTSILLFKVFDVVLQHTKWGYEQAYRGYREYMVTVEYSSSLSCEAEKILNDEGFT